MSRTTRVVAGFFVTMAVIVGSACGASTPATMKAGSSTVAEKPNDAPVKEAPSTTATKKPKKSNGPSVKSTKGGSFCDMADGYENVWETAIVGAMSMDEESDPAQMVETMKSGMGELFGYIKEMAKDAPAEIRADLKLLIDASEGYLKVLGSAESLEDPALEAADEAMSAPELEAASDRLTAFMQDHCGTEFSPEFLDMNS